MKNLFKSLRVVLNSGHERSVKAKKNIAASFILKFISIGIGLLLVPLSLNYLDSTRYGIWLTISSIVGWFSLLDIGLANGLRTKFAEAIAKGDKIAAREYVSTIYAVLSIIIGVFFILFLCLNPLLNWTKILNTKINIPKELALLVIITVSFFCLRFIAQIINTILLADQRPAWRDLIELIGKMLVLIIVYTLIKTTSGSLLYLGLAYSAAPVIILIVASIFFYRGKYREFIPSIKYVNLNYSKDLMNLGFKFFFIEISGIILFSTDNIIITQLYDPSYVTLYQIAHKYFFLIIMGFTIIISPFWSAVTEAYTKNDFFWIKNSIRKLIKIWIGFVVITIVMTLVSGWVYKFWIGDKVHIPLKLSIGMALFVLIRTLNSPFSSFLNGVGKIKIELYSYIFVGLLNIPLSIFYAKYLNIGTAGVILATATCFLITFIFLSTQSYKIINKKARGIWNE